MTDVQTVPFSLAASEAANKQPTKSSTSSTSSTSKVTPSAGKGLPDINPAKTTLGLPGDESTQTDIDNYLKSYVSELTNLGPEYSKEMSYLAPYLTGQSSATSSDAQAESVAKSIAPSGVQSANLNSPINTTIDNAEDQLGTAIEAQTPAIAKDFDNVGSEIKGYEDTIPYSDVLNSVLGAGKNELLYGSVPDFSAISTQGWSPQMQSLYDYLSAQGTTNELGNPNVAAGAGTGAPTSAGATSVPTVPSADLSGGGNTS